MANVKRLIGRDGTVLITGLRVGARASHGWPNIEGLVTELDVEDEWVIVNVDGVTTAFRPGQLHAVHHVDDRPGTGSRRRERVGR